MRAWEYEVLDHCFEQVDFISLHTYFRNDADELSEYFAVLELHGRVHQGGGGDLPTPSRRSGGR